MTRTTPLWIGLALALGCGAEVPADGGMQRIELTDKAHKPNTGTQDPAAIQDNSFRPVEQKGDPAAIQDNTRPVEQKGIEPQSRTTMTSKRETKTGDPTPAKPATAVQQPR